MNPSSHLTPPELTPELTFDNVARTRHEVTYEEVASHFAGPMSKHPVISVKGHPEVVWVRPDMGVGMVSHPLAFAVGSAARQIPWREVKRSLKRGYLPILISTWHEDSLVFTQTCFASLIDAPAVKTGREKQIVAIEMTVLNSDPATARQEDLWVFVPANISAKGIPPFPYNTYDLFEIVGTLPPIPDNPTEPRDNVFREGFVSLGVYRTDPSIHPVSYDGIIRFRLSLRPGETKSIQFLVTSSAKGLTANEIAVLNDLDFSSALEERAVNLESILDLATKIQVPDAIVNDVYRAQILHVQSQMLQAADKDYCLLVQGFQGVWPWEVMKFAEHWDSIGYHDDVRKCLEYFLQVQGQFPPHGNFKDSDGVFGGTIAFEKSGWEKDQSTFYGQLARLNAGKEGEFPNWMNGTGAMLHAYANHYRYTRDRRWLERLAPALIRACNWIISERQATKQVQENGEKVLQYGLLPVGRAYDTAEEAIRQLTLDGELAPGEIDDRHMPLDTYYPCWTDSYSSLGLTSIAEALAEIDHPEGARLLAEARTYRDDVLEVMSRTRTPDPSLPPYPERLYRPPAWAEFATGALAYLDTGFMEPGDAAFEQLESYMKKKWNRGILGLTGGMEKNSDPHGADSFYVNFSEDIWNRGWLLRNEIEKALLAFYSMLGYGMDKQTLATVERFHLTETRYAPFFMDTSASARVCGLIRQMLLMQEGKVLHLLAGVPRAWLNPGKCIELARGLTTAAKVDLSIQSELDEGRIIAYLTLSDLRTQELSNVRLRVPHFARQKIKAVSMNGHSWAQFDADAEVIECDPQEGATEFVITF